MMKKIIYEFIFYKILRWKLLGKADKNIKKSIFIVIPHTSWQDFYIAILTRGIMDMDINFVAKKELFKFPFGFYFRWMGGRPLDRSGNLNKVDSISRVFDTHDVFRLGIAPEGTRAKVEQLKTGFYYIALKASIPIIPVAFDYGKRQVRIGEPFYPSGNIQADLMILGKHFKNVKGRISNDGYQFD